MNVAYSGKNTQISDELSSSLTPDSFCRTAYICGVWIEQASVHMRALLWPSEPRHSNCTLYYY